MRKKELKLIISFPTTADAIACEKACHKQNIAGKLIPVPHSLSTGCGLAWAGEITQKEDIESLLKINHIDFEGIYELLI